MAANTKLEESLRRLGMTEVADDPGSVARLSKRLGDKMAAVRVPAKHPPCTAASAARVCPVNHTHIRVCGAGACEHPRPRWLARFPDSVSLR